MFRGPSFIVSTMQEETTPIFKRLWYDWTQQPPGIEPTNPLGQCWVPPIVAFYDQQGLMRTYSLPGSSIRSPHPGSLCSIVRCFPKANAIVLFFWLFPLLFLWLLFEHCYVLTFRQCSKSIFYIDKDWIVPLQCDWFRLWW